MASWAKDTRKFDILVGDLHWTESPVQSVSHPLSVSYGKWLDTSDLVVI